MHLNPWIFKDFEKNKAGGRLLRVDLMQARQESRGFCTLAGISAWLTKA